MKEISKDLFLGSSGSVLYSFSVDEGPVEGKVTKVAGNGSKKIEIKAWGPDNLLPNTREAVLMDNNIIGTLISKKRDILLGQGLAVYTEMFQDGKKKKVYRPLDPPVKAYLEELNYMELFCDPAALDFYKNAGFFLVAIFNRDREVTSMEIYESKYMRAARKVDGKVKDYYYCPDWNQKKKGYFKKTGEAAAKVERIPAWDPKKLQAKAVIYKGDKTFFDGYYFHPTYWGGRTWIDLANAIPVFHRNNLSNRYALAFHITYPDGYFMDKSALQAANQDPELTQKCYDQEEAAKTAFLSAFDSLLSSESQAGRTIHSSTKLNEFTKTFEAIEIKPLQYDMKDEALLKLFEKTNEANISGQGIHPSIANILTQGKLSSGSEIRNSFLFYIATSTYMPRQLLTSCIVMALKSKKLYKEGDFYTFEDYVITKLDDDKSGMKSEQDE